jgi:hypothetical protein
MPDKNSPKIDKNQTNKDKGKMKKSDLPPSLKGVEPSRSMLSSYIIYPRGVMFEAQDPEEEILLMVRRHPITMIKWALIVGVMIVAPLLLIMMPFFEVLPGRYQLMSIVLWYLLTTAVVLEGFFDWFFDVFIITDERIIDIDFKNLIYKNVTATKIDRIEDVTYTIGGALPSFFNYGSVLVQTAGAGLRLEPQGAMASLEIWNTPKPSRVAKLINEMILQEEQEAHEGRVR